MTGKYIKLYLYLALACFIGIILIFVLDGYMGLYDTTTITSGEIPMTFGVEQWQQQNKYDFIPSVSIGYGDQGIFNYEIANRRFSSYNTEISVSLWRNQEKVTDILTEAIAIKAFSNNQVEWTIDTTKYISEDLSAGMTTEFTLLIKHGEIERKMLIYVYSVINQSGLKIIPPQAENR